MNSVTLETTITKVVKICIGFLVNDEGDVAQIEVRISFAVT